MYLFMDLTIVNLKTLKELGFKLSNIALGTIEGIYTCSGKHIGISGISVFIQSGGVYRYQIIPICSASEIMTLHSIGMTPQEIFKSIQETKIVIHTNDSDTL